MVHADVGREPAQDARQIVMRASVQGRLLQGPLAVMGPERRLELVLHVEQPDPGGGRQQHDGQVYEQERLDADEPDQSGGDGRNREIGRHGAEPGLPASAHQADWQPVLQDEQVGGADAEHDEGVAIDPIAEPAPKRPREIFAHRQGIDVADPAPFEVAGAGVMDGMRAAPEIIGRECQHADDPPHPVVRQAMTEERTMPAIVLDHEQPHEESRGRHG